MITERLHPIIGRCGLCFRCCLCGLCLAGSCFNSWPLGGHWRLCNGCRGFSNQCSPWVRQRRELRYHATCDGNWGRSRLQLIQSQVRHCVVGSIVCVLDSERTGMCRRQLCNWPCACLEDLQCRGDAVLLPYAWLYETLNDEHSSCQAYDGISLVTAAS